MEYFSVTTTGDIKIDEEIINHITKASKIY